MVTEISSSAKQFVDEVRGGVVYTFARYGDGEVDAMLGISESRGGRLRNCNFDTYNEKIKLALRESFLNSSGYRVGLTGVAVRLHGKEVEKFLAEHGMQDRGFYNTGIFHKSLMRCMKAGKKFPMLEVLQDKGAIVVGPAHLKNLSSIFPVKAFYQTPSKDMIECLSGAVKGVERVCARFDEPTFISISGGLAAEPLIHELHKTFGGKHWLVDMGSVWDPFVGVNSRQYTRNMVPRLGLVT